MCFQIGKGRLTTRRVYKVFYQEPDGTLVGIYHSMRYHLNKVKRLVARGKPFDSEDTIGRSKEGLYVYTNKARALRSLSLQRSYGARAVLVLCEVEPEDFLHRSANLGKFSECEATYRAIKPLKVIS